MKITKLFQNGQSQAVRLPKEFHFEVGKVTILLPVNNPWAPLLESLDKFSDDFMDTREQPKPRMRIPWI